MPEIAQQSGGPLSLQRSLSFLPPPQCPEHSKKHAHGPVTLLKGRRDTQSWSMNPQGCQWKSLIFPYSFSHSEIPGFPFLWMKLFCVQRWWLSEPKPRDSTQKPPNANFNIWCKQDVKVIVLKSHLPPEKNSLDGSVSFFLSHNILTSSFLTGLETVISSLAFSF